MNNLIYPYKFITRVDNGTPFHWSAVIAKVREIFIYFSLIYMLWVQSILIMNLDHSGADSEVNTFR